MEIRKLDVNSLSVPEILSLLEIARGLSSMRPDWGQVKRELARFDAWGFYDREALIGYTLVNCPGSYLGGSAQIVELKYRWDYNRESTVAWMLCEVARAYQGASDLIVMDVHIRQDLNVGLYRKLGFANSVMRSPLGRDRMVMFSQLDSLLKNGFNA